MEKRINRKAINEICEKIRTNTYKKEKIQTERLKDFKKITRFPERK